MFGADSNTETSCACDISACVQAISVCGDGDECNYRTGKWVRAVQQKEAVTIVIDSGADASVFPLSFAGIGIDVENGAEEGGSLQDAQGKPIHAKEFLAEVCMSLKRDWMCSMQ